MKLRLIGGIALALTLVAAPVQPRVAHLVGAQEQPAAATDPGALFLPLTPGTVWFYEGTTTFAPVDGAEAQTGPIAWRTEVVEVAARAGWTAALLRGHPSDVVFMSEGRQPSEFGYVVEAGGRYYRVSADTAREAIARLRTEDQTPLGLLASDQIFLELPLEAGNKICGSTARTSGNDALCWIVDASNPVQLVGIAGLPENVDANEVVLRQGGNVAGTAVSYVSGIGITAFSVNRGGDTAITSLRLVEVRRP